MSERRSKAALYVLANGAPLESALALMGGQRSLDDRPLKPAILNDLFDAAKPDDHPRVAELALEAMRPTNRQFRYLHYPYGLLVTTAVALTVNIMMMNFVTPVFEKMYLDFGVAQTISVPHTMAFVILLVAGVLGVLGIIVSEGRPSTRQLLMICVIGFIPLFWPLLLAIGPYVSNPRRRSKGRIERSLRWLAAGTVAGLSAEVVLQRLPRPSLFDTASATLARLANEGGRTLDIVRRWAADRPDVVRHVASGVLPDEDDATAIARVARTVGGDLGNRKLGTSISVLGFALLVAGVYVVVAPLMQTISMLGAHI